MRETEIALLEMFDLDHQIKVLEAKYKRLKEHLIETHFANNQEFIGSEGLVLATYKPETRNTFMTTEFKKDYAELHKLYSAEQVIKKFSLKR